jgi:hypothetical protein
MFPDSILSLPFAHEFATRQDLNVAFDKVFNFQWSIQANAGRFRLLCFVGLLSWMQRRIIVALPQFSSPSRPLCF